jgi:hypothetical protein
MKKYILIILGFAISLLSAYSQTEQGLMERNNPSTTCCGELQLHNPSKAFMIDSVICDRYVSSTGTFEPYTMTVNTYDSSGRIIESVSGYYYSNGDYRNNLKYEFSYTQFDSLLSRTDYYWNDTLNGSGDWDNSMLYNYTYDNNQRLTYVETLYSPLGYQTWQPNRKEHRSYGSNGLIDEIVSEYWNSNLDSWLNYMRYRFVYNANDMLVEKYYDYSNSQNGIFNDYIRYLYSYETKADVKEVIQQSYNQVDWINSRREIHWVNDKGLSTVILEEMWSHHNNMWDTLLKERHIYEYNNLGKITDHIYMSSYIEWFNISREMYDYDSYGNLLSSSEYNWNHSNEYWEQVMDCQTKSISGLSAVYSDEVLDFNVFPNPTSGFINISYGYLYDDQVKVTLMNANGQSLKELVPLSNDQIQLDLSGYQTGVYFVELEVNGFSKAIKKILLR